MIPSATEPESGPTATDAPESAFRLLASRRQRSVLRYLNERGRPVSLSDLAERIALEERSAAAADANPVSSHGPVAAADRRRVALSLRHTHLPMLAEAGAIAFDTSENAASLTADGRALCARSSVIRGAGDTASTTHTTVR